MNKIVTAILAGVILGVIGARCLFVGSWLNLIPWGIVGVAFGMWGTRNEAVIDGVVFGFTLAFVFMIAGYTGAFSLANRLPFFAILGVFGAVCGLALGLIGFQIKTKSSEKRRHRTEG